MTLTQLLPRKETNMDPDRLVAYGIGILGLISTALTIYWSFRKNKGDENSRQIDQIYGMLDRQRQDHVEDMGRVESKLEKCEAREEQWSAEKLVSINLSSRQDAEIRSLTSQVKSLTESLLAAGIDRRGRDSIGGT